MVAPILSHNRVSAKWLTVTGIVSIFFSALLHGVNLCYARLSQLFDMAQGSGYMQKLIYYFDPLLTVSSVFFVLLGVVLIIYSVAKRQSKNSG